MTLLWLGAASEALSLQLRARDKLLHDHARDGDHCQPAVVDLLLLHRLEARRILRLEAERIELEVASDASLARREGLADLEAAAGLEGDDREELEDADGQDDRGPELLQRRGLEGDVRRHVNVAAEERVELLADEEAEGREHGDAAVLQLDLAPIADSAWERETTAVRVSARADASVRIVCWRSVAA